MKTTTVRKLLPESWGFLCPVHTPDGSPCGLLNHITLSAAPLPSEEIDMQKQLPNFKRLLTQLGMNPVGSDFGLVYPKKFLPVMLDGRLMGHVDPKLASDLVKNLRQIKIAQHHTDELYQCVPKTLEIAFLPTNEMYNENNSSASTNSNSSDGEQFREKFFNGIFLASTPARFVRPV